MAGSVKEQHILNPFGNPEGARADIDEVTKGFIEFDDPLVWRGLATKPDDLSARILVGQKGSGKTVYLRRAREHVVSRDDVFAAEMEVDAPATADILRFSSIFQKYDLREHWSLVWERAILRSVASRIANDSRLNYVGAADFRARILADYAHLIRPPQPYRSPVGVYDHVRDMLTLSTYNAYHTYLNDTRWSQLETEIEAALRHLPPICIYLDGVDDNFQHAPMHWLECQLGLYNAIMQLLHKPRISNRLHVFSTVRDLVYVKVLQGEHALRNYEEPHVRNLSWSWDASVSLLEQKVAALDGFFFPEGSQARTIEAWLGDKIFQNKRRNVVEPMRQYLLRHTRLLPRDIVTLGNLLCQELQRVRWFGDNYTRSEAIARAVRFAAKHLGQEQLTICAHQIAADAMTAAEARKGRPYVGTEEYVRSLTDDLKEFIRRIGRDRFSRATLLRHDARARTVFGEKSDVLSVLWLSGLLGYIDPQEPDYVVFYGHDKSLDFRMPRTFGQYALHSSLIDSVDVKATGRPVVQCR